MITSGEVKTIQTKCFTFTEEKRSGLGGETFAGVTSKPGGEIQLDCSRSRVCRIQEEIVQYLYY